MSNGYLQKKKQDMRKAYLAGISAGTYGNGYKDGYVAGQRFQGMVYLLAMNNAIIDLEMDPPETLYSLVEKEAQAIMDEIENTAEDDAEIAFDLLAGHVNEVRVKYNMPYLDWWNNKLDQIMLKAKEKESAE